LSNADQEPSATGDSNDRAAAEKRARYRKWAFRAVNVWLVFHLASIVIAAGSVSPSSSLVQSAWLVVRPYLQFFYLNHGYHYFAPEPSSSTLVSYTAQLDDGTLVSGRIPNRDIQPRLMYHRHFMLTEFLTFAPSESRDLVYRSYANQLGRRLGVREISLARVTHYLPLREAVLNGARLDDAESYAEEPLGTFQCDSPTP
jgi:hypothetical protein